MARGRHGHFDSGYFQQFGPSGLSLDPHTASMARDARLGPFDAPALAPMQRITSRESGRDTGQIRGPEIHPNLGCLGHVVIVHARLWRFARHVPRRIL